MKKIVGIIIFLIVSILLLTQCAGDFLDIPPKGVLTEDNLTDVESFVIAAYSHPPKQNVYYSMNPQIYGCIRSDDSYKGGGGGLGDQVGWYQMEVFTLTGPNEINYERSWEGGYAGIRRCNIALQQLSKVDAADFPLKEQ
ncbi:MAG: RagB/SusD family nutrient uptake outer membrane protein, partial [Bacteroidales bacterium]|nr:RagB/SusD family nutrient uptake outer membrane protein [Bacteroidales bacterium]